MAGGPPSGAKPVSKKVPPDQEWADTINENFEILDKFRRAQVERNKDLEERIQALEAAALGKPLEEVT